MIGELKDINKKELKTQFLKEIAMDEVDQILDELGRRGRYKKNYI